MNKKSFFPRSELDKILRRLRGQRLDQEFYYDKLEVPTLELLDKKSKVLPNQGGGGGGVGDVSQIQTPPLPQTPMPVVNQAQMAQKDPQTNLTRTETALLSPTEQIIAGRT